MHRDDRTNIHKNWTFESNPEMLWDKVVKFQRYFGIPSLPKITEDCKSINSIPAFGFVYTVKYDGLSEMYVSELCSGKKSRNFNLPAEKSHYQFSSNIFIASHKQKHIAVMKSVLFALFEIYGHPR